MDNEELGKEEPDNEEPWYIRYGGGYLAYLFYLPPVLIAVIAGFGWYSLLPILLEHLDWVYSVYYYVSLIPFGWALPYLVVGLGAFLVIRLLFFLGKKSFWQSRVRQTVLVWIGIAVVCIAMGMACGSHLVLGEGAY